jgi:hypothetical protein
VSLDAIEFKPNSSVIEPSQAGGKGGTITPIRDPNRARELQKRSTESRMRRRAIAAVEALRGIRQGVAEVAVDGNVRTWRDAWRLMNAHVAQSAYEGDPKALLALGKTTGLTETDKSQAEAGITANTVLIVSDAVAARMLDKYGGGA